ncbi:MAG TPA: ribose 5-phosphate isomerase B [Gemmatimonadaceae bacterium]|nr:ribose 5-phosphate isomerase B [Gemmatimonadaceae bacterium]
MTEEILIASDHAGFELKEKLEAELIRMGFAVRDLGTNSADSTDYADYAHPLAREVSEGKVKRGVLLCGTGLGMSYVANRYPNVRAAVTWSPEVAELARSHNDANVLVLPARFVSDADAVEILRTWLETPFEGGRHERRVVKIEQRSASQAQSSKPRANTDKSRAPTPKPPKPPKPKSK